MPEACVLPGACVLHAFRPCIPLGPFPQSRATPLGRSRYQTVPHYIGVTYRVTYPYCCTDTLAYTFETTSQRYYEPETPNPRGG